MVSIRQLATKVGCCHDVFPKNPGVQRGRIVVVRVRGAGGTVLSSKRRQGRQKAPVFLSSVDSATYGVLRDLLAPGNPKEKSFVDIVAALKEY